MQRNAGVYCSTTDKKFVRRVRDNVGHFQCEEGERFFGCPCNDMYYEQFGASSESSTDNGSCDTAEWDCDDDYYTDYSVSTYWR